MCYCYNSLSKLEHVKKLQQRNWEALKSLQSFHWIVRSIGASELRKRSTIKALCNPQIWVNYVIKAPEGSNVIFSLISRWGCSMRTFMISVFEGHCSGRFSPFSQVSSKYSLFRSLIVFIGSCFLGFCQLPEDWIHIF